MKKYIILTEIDSSWLGIIQEIRRKIKVENIYKVEQLKDFTEGSCRIFLKTGESIIVNEDRSKIHKLLYS